MPRRATLLAALAAPLLAACAAAPEPAGTAAVSRDWSEAAGRWSSGGSLIVAATVQEDAGRVALCGAWTTTRQSVLSRRHNVEVMAAGSASLGRERLVTGLGFMPEVPRERSLAGATARCVRTALAWRPGAAEDLRIQLPRMEFEYDEESGPLAVFRQTRGRGW
jgi:hypothetical protein